MCNECDTHDRLCSVIFPGQRKAKMKLSKHELRMLNQITRISVFSLKVSTPSETKKDPCRHTFNYHRSALNS